MGPQFPPWRCRVLASGSAKLEQENVPSATTRRPECGLFILGLSCRHSSTFFHRSGCPSSAHVSRPRPSQRPQSWWGGGQREGIFSNLRCPVSLHLPLSSSIFLSVSLWACASVSLTQELRALVFKSQPCPDSLHGLCPLSSPSLTWPVSIGSDGGTDMGPLEDRAPQGAWLYPDLQPHREPGVPFLSPPQGLGEVLSHLRPH